MVDEKKVVPKLWQEVKVKVDIVTRDDIKIYYIGKFHDFTAKYIIKPVSTFICYRAIKCFQDCEENEDNKKKSPSTRTFEKRGLVHLRKSIDTC